jgi:hypothetical protein
VNDGGGLGGAEPGVEDDSIGQPIECGRYVATSPNRYRRSCPGSPNRPNLVGERGVKSDTSPRQAAIGVGLDVGLTEVPAAARSWRRARANGTN